MSVATQQPSTAKDAHGPAPEPTEATPEERGSYALARYAVQSDYYVGLYETWAKSILFLLNKHYAKWDPRRRMYSPDTDVPAWRQQPVNPFTYAVYRSALAKLIKQRPVLEVVPPSSDSEDAEAARLGEALLQHFHRHLQMPARIKRALGWFLATGTVWGRVYWDAEAGKPIALTEPVSYVDDDGNEIEVQCPCDEHGEPIMKDIGNGVMHPDMEAEPHMVAEGDVAFASVSPLMVRMNPEAEDVQDAYEMFVGYLWPIQRASSHFGIPIEELESGSAAADELAEFDDLLASAASAGPDILGVVGGADRSEAIGTRCLVLEYYRDICKEYPEGRHWIQVGGKVVWPKPDDKDFPEGEAPLPDGLWPPLVPLQDTPNPSSPHAIGLLENVVPLNEKYNHLDGKILEHEVTMSMGGIWWTTIEDKGIKITSDPAQVRVSKGYTLHGKPPIQAKLEALPDEVYRDRDRIQQLLHVISGLGEIGMGSKPEGVTSGRGFLVLQEVVDSVFTPSLEALESFYEEVGRRMLLLARKYYREERTIAVRGSRGAYEYRSFKGANLKDGLDVRVQTGSAFPWSKSAKLDTAIELVSKMPQIVTGPDGSIDKEQLARILDQGGITAFQSEDNPDMLEIEREHAMFEAYNPDEGILELPQIGFWQNHAAHQVGHYNKLKEDRGRIDRWHPAARQAFLRHTLETTRVIEQTIAAMSPAQPQLGAGAPTAEAPSGDVGVNDHDPASAQLTPADRNSPQA